MTLPTITFPTPDSRLLTPDSCFFLYTTIILLAH